MKIIDIFLREGLFFRKIVFSNNLNLIHSDRNSKGKTTLVRYLLYALGYNIPNTKGINFARNEVILSIEASSGEKLIVSRKSISLIQVDSSGQITSYVLPEQENELHKRFWGIDKKDVLNNLLGCFYADQEKGWTLLNRGTVVGSVHFNIDELIRGLSECDCSPLISQEKYLSRQLGKYRQMFSISQYRDQLQKEQGSLIADGYEERADGVINQLFIELEREKKELHRIDQVLSNNKKVKQFISEMKLIIKLPDGSDFPVSEGDIVGLNDSIEFLVAKRKIVSGRYSKLAKEIDKIKASQKIEKEQIEFLERPDLLGDFDQRIGKLPLNSVTIKNEISKLEKDLKIIRQSILQKTRAGNPVANEISSIAVKYALEMDLGDKESNPGKNIFTSNLKELSGAILHKTIFAFKLAYITAVKNRYGVKLPIILDSPSGKEIDKENIRTMMTILKRDFSDHQIIIASIFTYDDLDDVNVIEIENRLIE